MITNDVGRPGSTTPDDAELRTGWIGWREKLQEMGVNSGQHDRINHIRPGVAVGASALVCPLGAGTGQGHGGHPLVMIAKVAVRIALWFRGGRRSRLDTAMRRLNVSRQRFHGELGHAGHDGLANDRHAEHSEGANSRSVDVIHRMIPKS